MEQATSRGSTPPPPPPPADGDEAADGLQTVRGVTTIADSVVSKVAGIAAREVPGVHDLGGGAERVMGAVGQKVGIGDALSQGVSVEVGPQQTAVALTLVVDYGESIPQVSQAVRDNVIKRIEGIAGLAVAEVNVAVNDLYFPGDDNGSAAA
jgi:uncharacterized alkaline shock family protein YloU